MQPVKRRPFMEQRCFAGVEVFRQSVVQHATTEGNDLASGVGNRKHQPREKFFMVLPRRPFSHQAESNRVFNRDIFLAQQLQESRTPWRRIPEHKFARRGFIHTPRSEILQRLSAFGVAQQNFLIARGGLFVDAIKILAIAGAARSGRLLASLNDNPVALRDTLHRFGKSQMIVLHQKVEDAATRLAAETVIDAFFLAHRKRGGFFAVERTKPHMVSPGFFQRDVVGDHFDDRSALANLADLFWADHETARAGGWGSTRPSSGESEPVAYQYE